MRRLIILIFIFFSFCACKTALVKENVQLISPSELEEQYTPGQDILLDVRTADEYNQGHIQDALNIDVIKESEFKDKIKTLDQDQTIFVYCRSGKRSANASKILEENGFKNIKDIEGGFLAWKKVKSSKNTP